MKIKQIIHWIIVILLFLLLAGCKSPESKKENNKVSSVNLKMNELTVPEGFEFQANKYVDLTLSGPSKEGFQLLQLNMDSNGYYYKLLGSAFLDANGHYQGTFRIPAYLNSVHIRFDRPGIGEIEANIVNGKVTVSVNTASASLKSLHNTEPTFNQAGKLSSQQPILASIAGNTSPIQKDGFWFVSDYNSSGVPYAANLASDTGKSFSDDFFTDLDANFPEYRPVPENNPEYLEEGALSDLVIIADAQVSIVFLHEGAGYRNTLAYFVYDTNSPPSNPGDVNQNDIVVALPNVSYRYSGGDLVAGDSVNLVNPRNLLDNYTSNDHVFTAGLSIGWIIFPNGFNRQSLQSGSRYYSIPSLNPEYDHASLETNQPIAVHAVLLSYDKPDKHPQPLFMLGFEDLSRYTGDDDFNDTMFSIEATPMSAIQTSGVTVSSGVSKSVLVATEAIDTDGDGVYDDRDDYPNDPDRARDVYFPSETTYNSLLFEDRWPDLGDYDFNDIVVDYRYKATLSANSIIRELKGTFILRATGAGYPNGFAISLPVSASVIASVTGQSSYLNSVFVLNENGVEASGQNSIIPIFDNAHKEFGVQNSNNKIVNTTSAGILKSFREFNVNITFNGNVLYSDLGAAPYNPFITVNGTRGREVHLMNHLPTGSADESLFLTGADDTLLSQNKTYSTTTKLPWAIEVNAAIDYPLENVQIPDAYLWFDDWAISGGTYRYDWHLDLPGYRNHSKIFGQ